MTIWVARAGKYGEQENRALDEGRAFIGWSELGNLSQYGTRDKIQKRLQELDPDAKVRSVQVNAGQIFKFFKVFNINDLFALPLKKRPAIAFGKVVGDYEFIADNPEDARHSRRIEWIGDPIPKSAFDQAILYSFNSALTVFSVWKNEAEKRVGKVIANYTKGEPKTQEETNLESITSDADEAVNLELVARDRISAFIGRKFKGHQMENLVAEVLRAQGFEVLENKGKGADGGADILAGHGPMGFDEPLLCVQVKSSDKAIEVKDYRELKGVMQNFKAKHGLLISWGGFKGSVENDARQDFFKISLWNAEDLVTKIQDVYTKLPKELQAKLPMQQIWMLTDGN